MAQHKWHKEIKAWADGAEIEVYDEIGKQWYLLVNSSPDWEVSNEYRIKPQPKEPQYLYVFDCETCGIVIRDKPIGDSDETYKGKIPLITENEDGA